MASAQHVATTFFLLDWTPLVLVHLRPDAVNDKLREYDVVNFTAFKNWTSTLKKNLSLQTHPGHASQADPWQLKEIVVHHVTFQSPQSPQSLQSPRSIRFMTVEAKLTRAYEQPLTLDRVVFLRGGSVAMLMILRPRDLRTERQVIMTEQPRIGAGSTAFLEIPAGMLDDSMEVRGKVLEEIEEETGFTIQRDELIDLTELAMRGTETPDCLEAGMYPSPANMDEYVTLFLWEKVLDRQEIEDLKDRLSGLKKHDNMITLVICNYEEIWRKGARDSKTLAAWALYEGLSREGKIQDELYRIRTGRSR